MIKATSFWQFYEIKNSAGELIYSGIFLYIMRTLDIYERKSS